MTAKIDRKLNVIIPVPQEDGSTLYAHCTPIDTAVFLTYALMMGKTFAAMYSEGLGILAGPRLAAVMLQEISKNNNRWEDTPTSKGVKNGLLAEIRRLINVLVPVDKGWELMTLDDAVTKKLLDATDESEVENAACFFTLAWHMHSKRERNGRTTDAAVLWDAQPTFLDCTAFLRFLKTWTPGENTGESLLGSLPKS